MRILAIETSCDETAVCVLQASGGFKSPKFKLLSNIVASQVKVHAPWGGVVPNLAKREHQKNLPIILKRALREARLSVKKPDVDFIAVTSGPGLEPALWVGITFSQELAKKWNKPLLGVNHLEGHIFSVLLPEPKKIIFPALALVVSGGHTELVLIKDWLKYRILGQTLDDAAGEAFDKIARLLGLGYPGGPVIAKTAGQCQTDVINHKIKLPRPMIGAKNYNFSFSGLKTAVLYKIREMGELNEEMKAEMCHEFQQAAIDVLISKTIRAAKEYKARTIVLGGGVAANSELRKQLAKKIEKELPLSTFYFPLSNFAGDNAAMIALTAYFRWLKQKKPAFSRALRANGNLKLV